MGSGRKVDPRDALVGAASPSDPRCGDNTAALPSRLASRKNSGACNSMARRLESERAAPRLDGKPPGRGPEGVQGRALMASKRSAARVASAVDGERCMPQHGTTRQHAVSSAASSH